MFILGSDFSYFSPKSVGSIAFCLSKWEHMVGRGTSRFMLTVYGRESAQDKICFSKASPQSPTSSN